MKIGYPRPSEVTTMIVFVEVYSNSLNSQYFILWLYIYMDSE